MSNLGAHPCVKHLAVVLYLNHVIRSCILTALALRLMIRSLSVVRRVCSFIKLYLTVEQMMYSSYLLLFYSFRTGQKYKNLTVTTVWCFTLFCILYINFESMKEVQI